MTWVLRAVFIAPFVLSVAADEVDVGTETGNFIEYNTATGSYTTLGSSSTVLWGLGHTSSGALYANDNGSAPNTGLYKVNATTGALTFVGDIVGSPSGAEGTLTSAAGGGALYYFDHSNELYIINPSNAVATAVGPLGFTVSGDFDVDFGPDGKLYATSGGKLYRINTSTGAGTLIGNSGELRALITGDGNLYGVSGRSMYSINLSNAQLTFLRSTPAGVGIFDDGTAVFGTVSTPEPAGAFSLLCGLLLVTGAVWSLRIRSRHAAERRLPSRRH